MDLKTQATGKMEAEINLFGLNMVCIAMRRTVIHILIDTLGDGCSQFGYSYYVLRKLSSKIFDGQILGEPGGLRTPHFGCSRKIQLQCSIVHSSSFLSNPILHSSCCW